MGDGGTKQAVSFTSPLAPNSQNHIPAHRCQAWRGSILWYTLVFLEVSQLFSEDSHRLHTSSEAHEGGLTPNKAQSRATARNGPKTPCPTSGVTAHESLKEPKLKEKGFT